MFAFLDSNTSKSPMESYLHDLQLYRHYPDENIPFIELERICILRAQVLLYVEKIYERSGTKETGSRCKARLIDTLKKNGCSLFAKIINGASKEFGSDAEVADQILQLRKQDHISHYMLRAAFALNNKRKWFHVQELRLFYWRLCTLTIEEMKEFLLVNELKTFDISEEDRNELNIYIKYCNLSNEMTFYKVPFTLVIDLVERREVFLRYGMAFVPDKELVILCLGYFRENLSLGLESIPIAAAEVTTDIRIKQIFSALTDYVTLQRTIVQENNGPSLKELDEVSKISYPLCMRIIHEKLRSNHHLFHGERVQYILFLKSIGVSLDDALELWREEFTKKIEEDKFNTEYGYRLKHLYGQTKTHKDYNCCNCTKIISFNVKPTESHGCPFKHLAHLSLRKKLSDYNIVPKDIEDIVQISSFGHCEEACKKYYEVTSNCSVNKIFQSPVNYFSVSRKNQSS